MKDLTPDQRKAGSPIGSSRRLNVNVDGGMLTHAVSADEVAHWNVRPNGPLSFILLKS